MENKENLCAHGEDVDLLPIPREAPEQKSRNRKFGRSNLRKSLAWNQAFFTEEGVLDPSELFVLTGSSTKSDETTPMVGHHKTVSKRARNISERKSCCKMDVQSEVKDTEGGCYALRELKFSSQEKHQDIMDEGDPPSVKNIMSNIPKPAAAYSQKRVAHTNTTNSASKLPKFMPKRSSVSSVPIAPRDVLLNSKNFKLNNSATKVQRVLGQRESSSCLKKPPDFTPLTSKSSGNGRSRPTDLQFVNGLTGFKTSSDASSPNLVPETSTSASIRGCMPTQKPDNVSKGVTVPPAPVHAKPSALRMPSPSLGFFNQDKLPRGFQPRRNVQLSQSNTPLIESIALNHAEQIPSAVPATPKYCPQSVICESRKNSDAINSVLSGSSVTFSSIKENAPMSQLDMISASQSAKSCSISADNCVGRKPQTHSGCPIPITRNSETYEDKLQVNSSYLVEEIKKMVKPLEPNIIKEIETNCQPITNICENRNASSDYPSDISLVVDTHESEIYEHEKPCLPKYRNKYPSPEEMPSKHSAVCIKNEELDGEGNLSSDKESGLLVMDGNSISSQLVETYFKSSEERTTKTLDIPESPFLVEFPSALSEDSEKKIQACKVQLDDNDITKPTEDADLVLDNNMNKEKLKIVPMKHSSNAIPFSDEWLAAMEAFGEEILARKTGAVQNSPQEKKHPEPSPWSPVKKVQEVGPYDCTKYSRNMADEDS